MSVGSRHGAARPLVFLLGLAAFAAPGSVFAQATPPQGGGDPAAAAAMRAFATGPNVPTAIAPTTVIQPNGLPMTTFSFTGAAQTYTVPAGVTKIGIVARGAQGGDVTQNGPTSGGLGATMSGEFAVVPGTVLTVVVGGKGNPEPSSSGGGGGSGVSNGPTALIVAGGGAGVDFQDPNYAGRHAVTTNDGVPGNGPGGAGGTSGGDGGDNVYPTNNISRGGRGFNSGAAGSTGQDGVSINTTTTMGSFGLGGGGGSVGSGFCNCGAGGGGYSGGGSGNINQSGGGGGSFNTGTNQMNTAGNNTGDGTVVITGLQPTADLAITKTDGVTTAVPGGSVTYTITASNAGPDSAIGATVGDMFPNVLTATWTCVGAGGGICTAAGSGNINDSVTLPAGGSVTYTVSATIAASATGSLSNTATVMVPAGVTEADGTNNSATDTDTLTPQADLAITKTDGVTTATPGGSVTYTITASNAGPSNAPGATVTDMFPSTLTTTWTCVGAGGGTCTAAGSGNIGDTVNLPAGGSVTYTVSATISGAATGSLTNTAMVAAPMGVTDPNGMNNSATDTDTLGAGPADLSITKTLNTVGPYTQGQTITYTLLVSNAGPATATNAMVTDTPTNLTITGVTGGGCTMFPCTIASLASGASVTITVTARITNTGAFDNSASVAGTGSDAVPANNLDATGNGGVAGSLAALGVPGLDAIGLMLLALALGLAGALVLRRSVTG